MYYIQISLKCLVISLLLPLSLLSQKRQDVRQALLTPPKIEITRTTEQFGDRVMEVLKSNVTAEHKEYEKDLIFFFKSKYAIKFRNQGGIHTANGVLLRDWSPDSLAISWKVDSRNEDMEVSLAVSSWASGVPGTPSPEVLNNTESSLRNQIRAFYHTYYNDLIADLAKIAEVQKKDVKKATTGILRVEKSIESVTRSADKEVASVNKADSEMSGFESQRKNQESELERMEQEKLELVERQDAIKLELSEKQREYNELNRQGNLGTKDGTRVMKDLDKIKARETKLNLEYTKKNEAIYKSKDAIIKTNDSMQDAEEDKRNHTLAEKDKRNKLESLRNDLDKARQKKVDEEKEMNEAIKQLENLKSAYSEYSAK